MAVYCQAARQRAWLYRMVRLVTADRPDRMIPNIVQWLLKDNDQHGFFDFQEQIVPVIEQSHRQGLSSDSGPRSKLFSLIG